MFRSYDEWFIKHQGILEMHDVILTDFLSVLTDFVSV